MTDTSDIELVNAYLDKGHDTAFVQLVRRYQIPVFRQLSQELADPDDAEQVCESVFLVASQRLREWTPEVDMRAWLIDLANEVSRTRGGTGMEDDSPRMVDPAVFFRQRVHRAVRALPDDERAVLLAVELEGKSVEEVASAQQLPVAAVTETLSRARVAFTATISSNPKAETQRDDHPVVEMRPGAIVDSRYKLEEVLGEGGMATVFRAEHLGIKREVALKTLRPTRQTQAMIRERFVREAEVLGRLAHPNFVDVSDFGESPEGVAYLVMELLHGKPLSNEIREQGTIAPARALRILKEVAAGLGFAHSQGIIHRDIKPDNIVLLEDETKPGFAKILDLGIASTAEDSEADQAVLFGTPGYMAPEQIKGQRIDGRVDIYAVGIMLFELLTGSVPFKSAVMQYVLVQHITMDVPKLQDVGVQFEHVELVQNILSKCANREPDLRYRNAAALQKDIEAALSVLKDSEESATTRRSSTARASAGATALARLEEEHITTNRWLMVIFFSFFAGMLAVLLYAFVL